MAAILKQKTDEFISSNSVSGIVNEEHSIAGFQMLVRHFNANTHSCMTVGVLGGFKSVDAAAKAIEYFGAKK